MDIGAIISLSIFFGLIALVIVAYVMGKFQRVTILEFQTGLKFTNGKLVRQLNPGVYRIWPRTSFVHVMDLRPQTISLRSVEVLTSDGKLMSASVVAKFKIAEAARALSENADYANTAVAFVEAALRHSLNASSASDVIARREFLADDILRAAGKRAAEIGIAYLGCEITELSTAENPIRSRSGFTQ